MTTWIKLAAAALVALFLFGAGFQYAAALYEAEKSDMIADYEKRARAQDEQFKGQLQNERDEYSKATSTLLAQLRESEDKQRGLAVDANRLRDELARRSRLPATGDSSCGTCEKRLAGCQRLLGEGVGLVEEGGRLVEQGAIRKDGLAAYSMPTQ